MPQYAQISLERTQIIRQKKRFLLLLAAAFAVPAFSCNQEQEEEYTTVTTTSETTSVNQQQQQPPDKNTLTGNWIRTDAEYRIQISEVKEDGKMKAGYFNPKSINVAEARWTTDGGILKIYVELRDENYPGSKYNLSYTQYGDKLSGEYYQAVERITYKVEFTRAK